MSVAPVKATRRFVSIALAGVALTAGLGAAPAALAAPAAEPAAEPAAPSYVWRSVAVGAGGFAPGIVFSPVERGLAYLRTDMGGAYRWDAGAGSWLPLQDGMAEGSLLGIESIAPDPVNPDVVWVAAGMYRGGAAAFMRSDNRGATWAVTPVPIAMGGNEPGRGVGERLGIDPANTRIAYFGSRHDGLLRTRNNGATWEKVASFPLPGLGTPPRGTPTNTGLSFVLFDKRGATAAGSRTIYVGAADPVGPGVYRSTDGGESWALIPGAPRTDLPAVKAVLTPDGTLYVTYANPTGPNGSKDGAVFRLDTATGAWTDITPDRPARSGFMGLAVGPDGAVHVSTLNRDQGGDTIYRSTDRGAHWTSLRERSRRDVSASPFLLWGKREADFGWWIAGLAVDPFDAGRLAYTTGATLYATDAVAAPKPLFRPWVKGIEQTAVITITSPPAGPPLLSGFGDISGFRHDDLDVSPTLQFTTPVFTNTNVIDYAGRKPLIVVRSGSVQHVNDPDRTTLAWSQDGGRRWQPMRAPDTPAWRDAPRYDPVRDAPLSVTADGSTFLLARPQPLLTRDRGRTWQAVTGLPAGARPVPDRVDPARVYALDAAGGRVFASRDGGASFAPVAARGLPGDLSALVTTNRETRLPVAAVPGQAGGLWLIHNGTLYRSDDGGARFRALPRTIAVEMIDFGRAPAGKSFPAVFAIARDGDVRGVYRSDDEGATWLRVNDDRHQWGQRFRSIAADKRVWGRVYVATDGRGILYGEPAAGAPATR